MSSKKTILICPLNWGLGHATRMIPIIDSAIKQGHMVLIASDGDALLLLQNHYKDIKCIELPSLSIKYSTGFLWQLKFLFSIPKIIRWKNKDTKALETISNQQKIDLIISDNRWGMWNKKVRSIFITHQLMIKLPKTISFLEKVIYGLQQRVLKHFDEIWIPDSEDKTFNLSGDLSHKYSSQKTTKFIGILSQFARDTPQKEYLYDIAIILSGPEPHRSILEKILLDKINNLPFKSVVVGGTFENTISNRNPNMLYIPFADTFTLQEIYSQSKHIICRSGYTSIMDLIQVGKTALLIPTPLQTEQEYLAKYVSDKGWFNTISQEEIRSFNVVEYVSQNKERTAAIELSIGNSFYF
jgi:uncharacterized protein (TIGR00661 family)